MQRNNWPSRPHLHVRLSRVRDRGGALRLCVLVRWRFPNRWLCCRLIPSREVLVAACAPRRLSPEANRAMDVCCLTGARFRVRTSALLSCQQCAGPVPGLGLRAERCLGTIYDIPMTSGLQQHRLLAPFSRLLPLESSSGSVSPSTLFTSTQMTRLQELVEEELWRMGIHPSGEYDAGERNRVLLELQQRFFDVMCPPALCGRPPDGWRKPWADLRAREHNKRPSVR